MWRQCFLHGSRAHWTFWAGRHAVWRSPRPCKVPNLLIPAIWLAVLHLLLRPRLRALHLAQQRVRHLALHQVRPPPLWQPPLANLRVLLRLRPRPHRLRPVLPPLWGKLLSPPLACPLCVALRPLRLVLRFLRLRPRLPQFKLLPFRLLRCRLLRANLPLKLAKCSPAHTSSSLQLLKNAGSTPVLIKPIPVSFLCARVTPLPLPSAKVWS